MARQSRNDTRLLPWGILFAIVFGLLGGALALAPASIALAAVVAVLLTVSLWWLGRTLFGIYLLTVTSVLLAYRIPLPLFNLTPFRAAIPLGVALLFMKLLWKGRDRSFREDIPRMERLGLYTVPLAVLYVLGIIRTAPDPQAIFKGLSFLVAITCVWLFTYFLSRKEHFHRIMNVQIATSLILALYGLYEVALQITAGRRPTLPFAQYGFESVVDKGYRAYLRSLELPRAESLLNDSNILGVYLSVALLFCIMFLANRDTDNRNFVPVYWFSAALISVCLILTLSRSALVGFVLGGLFVVAKRRKTNRRVNHKFIFGILIVILLLIAAYALIPAIQEYVLGFVHRFTAIGNESRRFSRIVTGLEILGSNALLGVGVGALQAHGLETQTAHSSYLTLLGETGVIGGLAFVVFVSPVLLTVWRVLWDRRAEHFEIAIAAGTVSLLAFEIFYDTLFLSPTSMVIFSLSYSYSLWRTERTDRQLSRELPAVPVGAR